MRKLGFSYLEAALKEYVEESTTASGGASWNTFLDPLTRHRIVKNGRLPGKKKMKVNYKLQAQLHKLGFKHLAAAVAQIQSEYEIPNKIFKDEDEASSSNGTSDDASLDHIRGEHTTSSTDTEKEYDETIREYLQKVGKIYKDRKKNFKL